MTHCVEVSVERDVWHAQHDHWSDFFQNILGIVKENLSNHHEDQWDHSKAWSLSVLLTDDARMRSLNHAFRGKDKPTNVLSFPSGDDDVCDEGALEHYLGDLAFSYDRVRDESEKEHKTFLNHMTHLTIHGILHLLGYDHETDHDAQIMESLEIALLHHMNIPNPYAPDENHHG